MTVGRHRPADGEPVGPGLFLSDAPLLSLAPLRGVEVVDQLGPLDARLHLHQATLPVQVEHAGHASGVQHGAAGRELLAAHCVLPSGHADPPAVRPGHGSAQSLERPHRYERRRGGVEPGVDVVEGHGCASLPLAVVVRHEHQPGGRSSRFHPCGDAT